jgi:hypothetical protein
MTSYEILEEIESIKYKISDFEYKKILDLLMKLNKEESKQENNNKHNLSNSVSMNLSNDITPSDLINILFNINPYINPINNDNRIFHNDHNYNESSDIILNDLSELSMFRYCKKCKGMFNITMFNVRGGDYTLNCKTCLDKQKQERKKKNK